MAAAPQTCAKSPCCTVPLVKLPKGANEIEHYRCAECQTLWVWGGKHFLPCELPDKHRVNSLLRPVARAEDSEAGL